MAKQIFPATNKVYFQNNRSNVVPMGNIWSTFNADLQSNVGVFRVSPRMRVNTTSVTQANLGCPVTFKYFGGKVWSICGTLVFTNVGIASSNQFVEDNTTGFQTDYSSDESDMEVFNGALVTSTTDALYSTDGSNWTARDVLLTGSSHVMTYFKLYDRLYYANASDNILSIDASWVTADPGADYAINLSPNGSTDYTIVCMRATTSFIWIGTINNISMGGPGKICQWDGLSSTLTAEHKINNAQGVMAIAIDPESDSPYAMDSNGVLSAWNGSGFSEVGRLPFPISKLPYNIGDTDNESFIHPNGMIFTRNGTLQCLINNRAAITGDSVVENMPSGVWEWSKETGFVHRYSISYTPTGTSTITDFGQNRVARVGALASMFIPITINTSQGTFLAGAQYYSDASTTVFGIFHDNNLDTIQKKGYFVTDWFESKDLADQWKIWWASYRKSLDSSDKIVFKYRNYEEAPAEGDITWVDTTHFTILNSAVDISLYWTSGTGGEVEILRGTGGGSCAHIVDAVNVGGTWSVTIDETITGVTTGTATARFQKWIKIEPAETVSQVQAFNQWAINSDSTPRIQIKGCFTFTGAGEFYQGVLTSNEDIKTD